jgi:hypothetical protein
MFLNVYRLAAARSALPLLVARIGTDNTNDPFAANDLAVLAKLPD